MQPVPSPVPSQAVMLVIGVSGSMEDGSVVRLGALECRFERV